jgi:hypothetical protein
MNSSSQTQSQLIQSTMNYCDRLIENLKTVSQEIKVHNQDIASGIYVDISVVNKKQEQARILKKRIYENIATIGFYSGRIEFDTSDFDGYNNMVLKKATFISSSIVDMINNGMHFIAEGTINNVNVAFRNTGYNQWKDGNVKVIINIYNDDLLVNNSTEVELQSGVIANIGDIVTFVFDSILIPQAKGVYNIRFSLVGASDNYIYCQSLYNGLNVETGV